MTRKFEQSLEASALRDKAEASFTGRSRGAAPDTDTLSPLEVREVVHELQVHQIELEMQNDELRGAQGRLHASKARYFDLYDLAPVGYCTLTAEGVVLEANLTVSRMLGIARKDLVNQPITSFLLAADQDTYYLHRRRFLESVGPHSCELRMVRKDGSELWVQLTATDVPAAYLEAEEGREGLPLSRLVLSDITDIKHMEEEKIALATRLHKAKKLETLGILAVGISHEFNNHLTAIMCNASTGGKVAENQRDLTRLFEAIETSALKATELVRQLLAYAGKAKWAMEEVDLNIVVKEICQSLAIALPWNLALTCTLADRVPYWRGDAIQVFQVALTLVMNSFEAFPEGAAGQIALRTRAEGVLEAGAGDGTWALPVVPGRYVVLEIEDNGLGMTPEILAQAFEPFFTTKAAGRGLGLAAVQGILSVHGGGLWVRSRPGRGTTFRVYLPAMAEAREPSGGAILSPWRGQGAILIVDFDRVGRSMARAMAEGFGFTVLEARGGLEAIEAFRLNHGALALVLLDRGLKGTSAADVLKAVQGLDAKVPVVFSADFGWKDKEPLAAGHLETVTKPYRPAEFQGVLQRALETRPPRSAGLNGSKRHPPSTEDGTPSI